MNNSFNYNVIEKLIDIEIKIYNSCQLMMVLKNMSLEQKSDKYLNEEFELLKILTKKENILLNQLPNNSEANKYIYNIVIQNQENFFDDNSIAIPVLSRFHNIMVDLVNSQEEKEFYEEFELDDDFDNINNRILIRNNYIKKNILYLNELIKNHNDEFNDTFMNIQYSLSFSYKDIWDELITNSFDISSLSYESDLKLARKMDLSAEDYSELKDYQLCDMLQDLFIDLINELMSENSVNINSLIVGDSIRFRFLLHELKTPLLIVFKKHALEYIEEGQYENDMINQLCNLIDMELDKRNDKPLVVSEPNKDCEKIDFDTADSIIKLVKLEEELLNEFDSIDFSSENNSEKINILSYLVQIEDDLIKKLKINYKNFNIINDLLNRDIDLFLNAISDDERQRRNQLIYDRLCNSIPFFKKMDMSPTQSEKSYLSVNQNHLISTLKIFEDFINKTVDVTKKEYLKELYKNLFFINPGLMDDYIFINGNYKMIDRFSDSLTSQIVGLSSLEYAFDKDEQLYDYAVDIIEDVLSYEDSWDDDLAVWAMFNFKLSELSDIMDNVSDEHSFSLPSIVKENNTYQSPKTKKIINKLMKNHLNKKWG